MIPCSASLLDSCPGAAITRAQRKQGKVLDGGPHSPRFLSMCQTPRHARPGKESRIQAGQSSSLVGS